VIYRLGGNDSIYGGPGADSLIDGNGTDTCTADTGEPEDTGDTGDTKPTAFHQPQPVRPPLLSTAAGAAFAPERPTKNTTRTPDHTKTIGRGTPHRAHRPVTTWKDP
jgi:hypothetical protein